MRYEVLMLAVPEITQDESTRLEAQLRDAVRETQGSFISFERWGKYRLAYPVNKNEYGVYFLARFETAAAAAPQKLLQAVRDVLTLKFNEIVNRYLLNRLENNMPLTYQRPESLEEMPGKTTDSLMREHRLEGHGRSRYESRSNRSEEVSTEIEEA